MRVSGSALKSLMGGYSPWFWASGLLLVVSFFLFLHHTLPVLTFGFEVKYGEGVLLDQVRRVHQDPGLYPAFEEAPYVIDNYPPIYPWLVSLIPSPNSAPFFAGRLISIASILAAAWLVGLIVRRGAGDAAAMMASAVFLVTPGIIDFGMRMRVDSLALAFGLLGFYATLAKGSHWRWLGCAAFFLCIYTRHSMFALLVAAYVLLFLREGKPALRWVAGLVVGGILAFIAGNLWYQGRLYEHLIEFNVLPYDFEGGFQRWFGGLMQALPLLFAGLLALRPEVQDSVSRQKKAMAVFLVLLVLAVATLVVPCIHFTQSFLEKGIGLLEEGDIKYPKVLHLIIVAAAVLSLFIRAESRRQRGRDVLLLTGFASALLIMRSGSDLNYLFEYWTVLCILGGLALGSGSPRWRGAVVVLLSLYFAINVVHYESNKNTTPERLEEIARKGKLIEFVSEIPGPILSLDPSVPAILGRPMEYQPF
ncbi:MAG: glycosyltransferase family 39 protein, partial [Planctomycetota bacterium]